VRAAACGGPAHRGVHVGHERSRKAQRAASRTATPPEDKIGVLAFRNRDVVAWRFARHARWISLAYAGAGLWDGICMGPCWSFGSAAIGWSSASRSS